ncbi:SDR family oxidoreductase [bacterium]|nr:SDR family oxidoreductase [bacterium]
MKTVLVTGAAGGIGQAVCELFHEIGYHVIGVDRKRNGSVPYRLLHHDIGLCHENGRCETFYREVEDLCEGELHALVNNAAAQVVKPVEELTRSDWDITLQTNLLAPFWLTRRFLPLLRRARGSVVNMASIHANVTKSEFVAYATSKGALISLTRAMAVELAPDVRVNAILPAATDTPMLRAGFEGSEEKMEQLGAYHPLGRIAEASEVARVARFLASDEASFITGSTLSVDGGIGAVLHDPVVAR